MEVKFFYLFNRTLTVITTDVIVAVMSAMIATVCRLAFTVQYVCHS